MKNMIFHLSSFSSLPFPSRWNSWQKLAPSSPPRSPNRHAPPPPPHIVLAAHWDSKREPHGMLGAMDSAVSILLLRQWMQEVVWWKELSQLIQWALIEEQEHEEGAKTSDDFTREHEAVSLLSISDEKFCSFLQTLLHPAHAAVFLEYAFPSSTPVSSPSSFSTLRRPLHPHHQEDDDRSLEKRVKRVVGTLSEAWKTFPFSSPTDPARNPSHFSSSPSNPATPPTTTPSYALREWCIAASALPDVTVLFFDGEEALVEWEGEDHTYGSRHLAQRWRETPWYHRECPNENVGQGGVEERKHDDTSTKLGKTTNKPSSGESHSSFPSTWMSSISTFILLDLIGGDEEGKFINFFPDVSGHLFSDLHHLEAQRRHAFTVMHAGKDGGAQKRIHRQREEGEAGDARKTEQRVLPQSWMSFGLPPLWYQPPPPPSSRSSSTMKRKRVSNAYFTVEEATRPRHGPILPLPHLMLEDDYMHWLDAGEENAVSQRSGKEEDDVAENNKGNTMVGEGAQLADRRRRTGRQEQETKGNTLPHTRAHLTCAMLPLVPLPLPPQWHTVEDDLAHVSLNMVTHFYELFLTFLLFLPS